MVVSAKAVALVGMIGHGKTHLINRICRTRYASSAGMKSCTRTVQVGTTRDGLFVIDTPGFGSSDEVAAHLAAQKLALEGTELSGVYIVIKFDHRTDNIVSSVEPIMDFLGTDDVRIIVTHVDHALLTEGFDEEAMKTVISGDLDIPVKNVALIGKDTPPDLIEKLVMETLHDPMEFKISRVQLAAVSSLSGAGRKYNKPINAVLNKLKAASQACQEIVKEGKSYETDITIVSTQKAATQMVALAKEEIFRSAFENLLDPEHQNLVYGKAGVSLSIALQKFVKTTNHFLRWDVSDPRDPRNHYRKCPNCDAVYVKVAGCDNIYTCGGVNHVPDGEETKGPPKIDVKIEEDADSFLVRYFVNGVERAVSMVAPELGKLMVSLQKIRQEKEEMQQKLQRAKDNGTRELNIFCHQRTSWDEMVPLTPEQYELLGQVEYHAPGQLEEISLKIFDKKFSQYEAQNLQLLNDSM